MTITWVTTPSGLRFGGPAAQRAAERHPDWLVEYEYINDDKDEATD